MTDTQSSQTDYSAWNGHQLVDRNGDKVGKIVQVYVDDHTGQPSWVTAKTGLFGNANSFVPIEGTRADGDQLVSAWDKDKIKGAPNVEDDGDGYLSPEEEGKLYSYYGVGGSGEPVVSDEPRVSEGAGHDTSGPDTDTAMTRSEEELRVGTQTTEAGRARLRKYVVTENVTQTVPVSHEEVRVEREPITDANLGAATDGPEISEEEHEVVLHEERPVVAKETVPRERVRLGTETVTEEATIDEQVRKEQIEQEGTEPRR